MSKRVKEALAARAAAENALGEVIKTEYPLGSPIEWSVDGTRNGTIHRGLVVDHSAPDGIKVRNHQSGKTLWIYAYRVVEVAA